MRSYSPQERISVIRSNGYYLLVPQKAQKAQKGLLWRQLRTTYLPQGKFLRFDFPLRAVELNLL